MAEQEKKKKEAPVEALSTRAKVYNQRGEETGSVELPEAIYGRRPKKGLLHEAVTAYLANQRGGNAHVKTRGEVSGGGKKPWRQKGTGRARHGSIRSPIWRGGGVAFGPRNTVNWSQKLPKAKLKTALAHALSARQAEGAVVVLEALAVEEPKTKKVAEVLKALKLDRGALFVLDKPDAAFSRASRNIPQVSWTLASDLNAYQALRAPKLVLTKPALEALERRWS